MPHQVAVFLRAANLQWFAKRLFQSIADHPFMTYVRSPNMLKSGNPRHVSRLYPNLPPLNASDGIVGNPQPRRGSEQPPKVTPIHSPESSISLPKIASGSRFQTPGRQQSDAQTETSIPRKQISLLTPPPSRFSDSGIHILETQPPRDLQSSRRSVKKDSLLEALPSATGLAGASKIQPGSQSKTKQPIPSQPQPKSSLTVDSETLSRVRGASKPKSILSPIAYVTRILICGVGLSAIAGTLLAVWNPATQSPNEDRQSSPSRLTEQAEVSARSVKLPMTQELTALKAEVQKVAAQNPGLNPGVLFVDLDTGNYLNINETSTFSAASTIKIPILVAFFQAIDDGSLRLDEELTLKSSQIVPEAGLMQYDPPGTRYTALEVATAAIVSSDNTATNMLIDRLGGVETLNQKFQSWGLTQTTLNNPLPDLGGTNKTSPGDLAKLISAIDRGTLMSIPSRDRLLEIMKATENDSLLPQGLGEGATIAHKTGTINSILADAGLVDLPNGKRYVAVVMVERTDGDDRAGDMIRQISSTTYQYFERSTLMPTTASSTVQQTPTTTK
jgi:beta-lactamase class A